MPARHSIDTIGDSGLQHPGIYGYASVAWGTANRAVYVPLVVPSRVVVRGLWFGSGTTGTGNVDMGLYDPTGGAVVSATNAAKIASAAEQVLDVTDTTVGPGLYYIALSSDSATDTFVRHASCATAPIATAFGVLTEASAYPLPATATMALNQTNLFVPVMGLLLVTEVS
jgi:hypothetical protein